MENLKYLLENGADVNHQDHLGFTPLMTGARNGNLEMIKVLISYGARLNTIDNKHFSALHYATSFNQLKVVKCLVENGAEINDKIYMTSILKNHKEITKYFDSLDIVKQIIKEKPKNRK